jgi:hypothetical protein
MNTAPRIDTAEITSAPSLQVRPVVVERAVWKVLKKKDPSGKTQIGFDHVKGTWFPLVVKLSKIETVVVPILSCPACGMLLFISTQKSHRGLMHLLGHAVPIVHQVSKEGLISPDIVCDVKGQRRCSFHRKVYLDRWSNQKPLYVIAYVDVAKSPEILFDYCHASNRTEAGFHFGPRKVHVIDVGRAVGYLYDEKNKTATADVGSKVSTPGEK